MTTKEPRRRRTPGFSQQPPASLEAKAEETTILGVVREAQQVTKIDLFVEDIETDDLEAIGARLATMNEARDGIRASAPPTAPAARKLRVWPRRTARAGSDSGAERRDDASGADLELWRALAQLLHPYQSVAVPERFVVRVEATPGEPIEVTDQDLRVWRAIDEIYAELDHTGA